MICVVAALSWLTAIGCRGKTSPAPFSRASVLSQLGPTHAGVTLPSDALPANIEAFEDLVYARIGAEDLALDLYKPKGVASAPVVVVVHGGGWERGDRRMERPLAKRLAARGFGAATLPDTPHPFWLVNPWFDLVVADTVDFFNRYLRSEK